MHIFIELILKGLDPNDSAFRKLCHKAIQNALHTIYTHYPNVSFHHDTQKYAVGTLHNDIYIFDLRTAIK